MTQLEKMLNKHFPLVTRDNMDHVDEIAQAYLIQDRFHLIKWKQGYYNGAFELKDFKHKEKDVILSTNLNWIIDLIKEIENE